MAQWLSGSSPIKLAPFPSGEVTGDIRKCYIVPPVRQMDVSSFEKEEENKGLLNTKLFYKGRPHRAVPMTVIVLC